MNKVTTINLNGRAYQLEEAGYEALKTYLDQAAAKLAGNPDKDEIMADFEQAIADKCDNYLGANKNVVTTADIEAIIAKMGPVNASEETADTKHADTHKTETTTAAAPKRLYRLPDTEWIAGVCSGLAAYFMVDVAIVRLIFVLLALVSHLWFGILVYIILAIVMPVAKTADEKEYAHGTMPFKASDFIEQATARYTEFQREHPNMPPAPSDPHDRASWKKWKEEMKGWKQRMKDWEKERRQEIRQRHREQNSNRHAWQNYIRQERQFESVGSGFFRFLMGLIILCFTALWIVGIVGIAKHHTIFGVAVAAGHPLWISIVFICALYFVVVTPLKLLFRNARPSRWKHYSFFLDLIQSIFFVFGLYLLVWTGRMLFPVVNESWSIVINYLHGILK